MQFLNKSSVISLLCHCSLLCTAEVYAEPLDDNFSADGYRISNIRSPVPESAEFAHTVSALDIKEWLEQSKPATLIDVYPLTWFEGMFFHTEEHMGIPTSLWLPNVGLGDIDTRTHTYFLTHLKKQSPDKKQPLIFYCRTDCWMSWNAAKRAREMGYQNLYWYREGIDDWIFRDLPIVPLTPTPMKP